MKTCFHFPFFFLCVFYRVCVCEQSLQTAKNKKKLKIKIKIKIKIGCMQRE